MSVAVEFNLFHRHFVNVKSGKKPYEYRGAIKWGWLLDVEPDEAHFTDLDDGATHHRRIIGGWAIPWADAPADAQRIYPRDDFIIEIELGEELPT